MKPTISTERIDVIDLIRGFALLGLPFVNVLALWRTNVNLSGTELDIWVQRFLYVFVEGRFYAIFSFLFGLGLWIFLSRVKEKSDHPSGLFIRRMLILLAAGALHHVIYDGETLLIYAIMGLPIIFLDKAPKQMNLILGIAGIILASYLENKLLAIFPYFLLGLAFGQYRVFEKYMSNRKMWKVAAILSFAATCVLAVFLWQEAPANGSANRMTGIELSEAQSDSNVAFYAFTELSLAFAPFFSIFYVSFLVLLEPRFRKMLSPLNAFGRMAFTNYIGQSVILLIIAMFFPVHTVVSYTTTAITCLLVVIAQIIASSYWLTYFKYGPLEWLWRCGTYGKWLSIRR